MSISSNGKVKVAILGSGNIGSDLMFKILRDPGHMELALLTGIEPQSEGLARARSLGVNTSYEGIQPILEDASIRIVFDATSAHAHVRHAKMLREAGRIAIDLTPAARGPYVIPPVNLGAHMDEVNVNLITCGGQATIPLGLRRLACHTYPVCGDGQHHCESLRGPRHAAKHR